jgi:hypothetical protein
MERANKFFDMFSIEKFVLLVGLLEKIARAEFTRVRPLWGFLTCFLIKNPPQVSQNHPCVSS